MFPKVSEDLRRRRLDPPSGPVRMVLDTDTYNEIDDQFALAYALLSPERLDVEAVYAAPFTASRSSGPGDGMQLYGVDLSAVVYQFGEALGVGADLVGGNAAVFDAHKEGLDDYGALVGGPADVVQYALEGDGGAIDELEVVFGAGVELGPDDTLVGVEDFQSLLDGWLVEQ